MQSASNIENSAGRSVHEKTRKTNPPFLSSSQNRWYPNHPRSRAYTTPKDGCLQRNSNSFSKTICSPCVIFLVRCWYSFLMNRPLINHFSGYHDGCILQVIDHFWALMLLTASVLITSPTFNRPEGSIPSARQLQNPCCLLRTRCTVIVDSKQNRPVQLLFLTVTNDSLLALVNSANAKESRKLKLWSSSMTMISCNWAWKVYATL